MSEYLISRRRFAALSAAQAALFLEPRFSSALGTSAVDDRASLIKPIIGASTSRSLGEGKTFPGSATPFGLVQLSPDTITGGDHTSGYSYDHTSIEGFSFMHLSGVGWYGDLGNLQVVPSTGPMLCAAGRTSKPSEGWRSPFRHDAEIAAAGYYSVMLDRYRIRAELTSAARSGMLRFTYPAAVDSRIQTDLARRIGGTSTRQMVKVVDEHSIEGWMLCPETGGGWGNGAGRCNYTVFFRMEFSRPLEKFGVWSIEMPEGDLRGGGFKLVTDRFQTDEWYQKVSAARRMEGCREFEGAHLGFWTEFATQEMEQVVVKAGISLVSVEGARKNLAHDLPGWDFNAVRQSAHASWNKALASIRIEGADVSARSLFATAMYHSMIDPRDAADADGSYRAADNSIGKSSSYTYRTIFSGWDVYRAHHPLMTIIRPDLVNDEINSLLEVAKKSGKGYLNRWEIMNAYSGIMEGDPAIAVIVDAWMKGIRKFDGEAAYNACRQTAAGVGNKTNRVQNEVYLETGYVPRHTSFTLCNAYFDACVAIFADSLGKREDARTFAGRSQNYRKIYDPGQHLMHGREADGNWMPWKGPLDFNGRGVCGDGGIPYLTFDRNYEKSTGSPGRKYGVIR